MSGPVRIGASRRPALAAAFLLSLLAVASPRARGGGDGDLGGPGFGPNLFKLNSPVGEGTDPAPRTASTARPRAATPPPPARSPLAAPGPETGTRAGGFDLRDAVRSAQPYLLFGLISLAPAGILMVTAFVRINIVLVLLRQALGSPQVPGNQVLTALALLLTALVMRPVGERVYQSAIVPYAEGRATAAEAWAAGSGPIKEFMVEQILKTNHDEYLWTLYRQAVPASAGRAEPTTAAEFPLRVVAPAFLLSELTTALVMGFYLYLPFLVIDLVVSAVLAAMGLFMLPPTLVAMPVKLIVFVLAKGWLLVASMLLSSFGNAGP